MRSTSTYSARRKDDLCVITSNGIYSFSNNNKKTGHILRIITSQPWEEIELIVTRKKRFNEI